MAMHNKSYEAEKAKYVDTLIFRVMELEAQNEILKERLNLGQAYTNSNSMKEKELRERLTEANEKYKRVTAQYAELKAAYQLKRESITGLRKVARAYAEYGFLGLLKKILGKL